MLVISPWSRGGYVCSETFDHTSVIRFLETWLGVPEPNISAWRRAICGDLTSAFDFDTSTIAVPDLPDTSDPEFATSQACARASSRIDGIERGAIAGNRRTSGASVAESAGCASARSTEARCASA